jgi:acetate kinase
MILIFDPDPPAIRWSLLGQGKQIENGLEFDMSNDDRMLSRITQPDAIEAVGYVLYHGGEIVKQEETALTERSLRSLERCIPFFPEYNEMTFKVAQHWMARFPGIPHFLFCDTAFFLDLPLETSTYAVPYALRKKGIRRYGGYGLFHQNACERLKGLSLPSTQRVLSVYLGNHSNVAAIRDGKPVETSIGFTPVEGIVSSNSCGDLDPTIVFQLLYAGMSLSEINRLLTRESGFAGLVGHPCTFRDIVRPGEEPQAQFAFEKLTYDVKRYIGGFIPILGGLDVIVFQSEDIDMANDLILDLCASLEFLGLRIAEKPRRQADYSILTRHASPTQVVCIQSNKADIIGRRIRKLMNKEGQQ